MTEATLPKSRRTQKREDMILRSLDVIADEGVHGATTRRLAAGIGVNLATLHYHFQDKDDLLLQIYDHIGRGRHEVIETEFASPTPLSHRIPQLTTLIWDHVTKSRQSELIVYELCLYGLRKSNFETSAQRKYEDLLAVYRDALAGATEFQSNPDTHDIDGLANFIFNGFVGIILQWLISNDFERGTKSVRNLTRAALTFPITKE